MRVIAFLTAFLFPFASVFAQVSATFNPDSVELGDQCAYIVNFGNVSQLPEGLQPPSVPGLTISGGYSTSTQMSIVNGRMSQKVGASWQVRPTREGIFTIPARTVIAPDGSTMTIPSATLTVTPVSQERREAIFWDITLPSQGKNSLLVGEKVPITISLFSRNDYQIASRINLELKSDGLSFESGDLFQSGVIKGGQSYQRRDWKGFITPNKSGDFEFSISAPNVAILIPGRGFSQQELTSPPIKISVSPLPLEGRPEHFDGAVGQYRLSQQQNSTQLAVGDALTVTLILEGNGDLQGSAGPGFPAADGLKIYPGRKPNPEADERGRLSATYTYTVIPVKAGQITLPAARFAYFDSAARQYVNISTKAVTLTVSPAASPTASAAASAKPGSPSPATNSKPLPTSYELNLTSLGAVSFTLSPNLLSSKSFLLLQAVPALVLSALVCFGLFRRRASHDMDWKFSRSRREALRHWSRDAAIAARAGDAASFRTAARRWLQHASAPRNQLEPAALSALEVSRQLAQSGIPADLTSEIASSLARLEDPIIRLGDLSQELKNTEALVKRVVSAKA